MQLEYDSGTLAALLVELDKKIVFAESCTAGLVAATMGKIPGISSNLCGSFVVYRASQKKSVLNVKQETIDKYTTESPEMAEAMVSGSISELSPEADVYVSVVGHLGPNAPEDKDGVIWCSVRSGDKIDTRKIQLNTEGRKSRMEEAVWKVILFTINILD